jgi:hypothetical protein
MAEVYFSAELEKIALDVPKLTTKGLMRYLATPAEIGLVGAGLGAAGTAGGHWRELRPNQKGKGPNGESVSGKTWVEGPSAASGALVGGAMGAALGGGLSAARYNVARRIAEENIEALMKQKESLREGVKFWRTEPRKEMKDLFRKIRSAGLKQSDADVLEEAMRKDWRQEGREELLKEFREARSGHTKKEVRESLQEFAEGRRPSRVYTPRFVPFRMRFGLKSKNLKDALDKLEDQRGADLRRGLVDVIDRLGLRGDLDAIINIEHEVLDFRAQMPRTLNVETRARRLKDLNDQIAGRVRDFERRMRERQEQQRRREQRRREQQRQWEQWWGERQGRWEGHGGGAPPPPPRGDVPSAQEILGIDPEKVKTKKEAAKAYRDFMTRNHPDRGGDPEKAKAGNNAWDKLKNSEWYEKLAFIHRLMGLRAA